MEGRGRAGWSAERRFLVASEGRRRGGWSAPGETCSPEDRPHLEDTRGQMLRDDTGATVI